MPIKLIRISRDNSATADAAQEWLGKLSRQVWLVVPETSLDTTSLARSGHFAYYNKALNKPTSIWHSCSHCLLFKMLPDCFAGILLSLRC